MKKTFSRPAMLILASIGALAAPVPAVSQEYDPCTECHSDCYQAYVVNSNQPNTYRLCGNWCNQQFCNGGDYAAPTGPELLAARLD